MIFASISLKIGAIKKMIKKARFNWPDLLENLLVCRLQSSPSILLDYLVRQAYLEK
jgi:hypothetical protein